MQVICPTWQVFSSERRQRGGFMKGYAVACDSTIIPSWERPMYFVAAVLAVLAGLFYAAVNNEIGNLGVQMCLYGSSFCDHPSYVLAGAILAAIWAAFVSIR
jgi:hypothetical protein